MRFAGMSEARYRRLNATPLNVATKIPQAAFADKARGAPGAKPHEVRTAPDGLQPVVADLQAQAAQVLGDRLQRRLAMRAVIDDHDGVVHVAAVVAQAQVALAEMVEAVEGDVCGYLGEQIPNRHAFGLRALRKHHDQRDKARVLDPPRIARLQHRSVDSIEELAHINVQQPRIGRSLPHCVLQPVGRLVRAATSAARKRGGNELALNDRGEHGIDGVLNHKVAKRGRLNHARLGAIANDEALAWRRSIGAVL